MNSEKIFIATQDKELRGKLTNIRAAPTISINDNILIMDYPSKKTLDYIKNVSIK